MKENLIVRCKNEKCFFDAAIPLNCSRCDEGKLYMICFKCKKENEVKDSTWIRIDCECGAFNLPCSLNSYKLEYIK